MQGKRYKQFLAKSATFRESVCLSLRGGLTQSAVARKFGISRQRVNQIVNYEAYVARKIVGKHVANKKIPNAKNLVCADCGSAATEYDHRDYKKPLSVAAVCKMCNAKRGRGKNGRRMAKAVQ